jgi:hypothetical protein
MLAQEQDALERMKAERWARNEPRREQWNAAWQNARPMLRIVMILMTLAVRGAIMFLAQRASRLCGLTSSPAIGTGGGAGDGVVPARPIAVLAR